jgi:hypothetical protein
MSDANSPGRPGSTGLHPVIYRTIVGLCLWLVISVWGFIGSGQTGLALTVVSLFIAVAVGIPVLLWRIWRGRADHRHDAAEAMPFGAWLDGEFEASPGRQRGVEAAVEVLLPIAAVAFGMSAFALVLHLAV